MAKREANTVVMVVKNNAYERLYQRLEYKERERRTRYLGSARSIENED